MTHWYLGALWREGCRQHRGRRARLTTHAAESTLAARHTHEGRSLFGRRKQEEAAAEAARENERRALFEKLAQRPETVCPFLGLADDRVGYRPTTTDEHRCYAFGDPAPLSSEQQERVCLQRGYGNCPRYLRGVLVIPTDELEALRHPRPMPPPPPPQSEPKRRRGFPVALAGVLVLLLLAAGGVGYLLTRPAPGVAVGSASPTPTATPPAASPSLSASASVQSSASTSASTIATPSPEPTPSAGDTFDHFEVAVAPGTYTIVRLDSQGTEIETRSAAFDDYSFANASEVASPVHSWLIQTGDYAGYSYVGDRSGPFRIRKVFLSPDGERRSTYIPDDER